MKKKASLITVLISLLIIVVGYFAYVSFIRSTYLNNEPRTVELAFGGLNNSPTIDLVKGENQEDIFSIEIEVTGHSSGIFDIVVANETNPIHSIALKGDEVDYIYKGDWYSDSCFLTIMGRDKARGKLQIEYRFLGLN